MSSNRFRDLLKDFDDDDDDSHVAPAPAPVPVQVQSQQVKKVDTIMEPSIANIPIPTGKWKIYYHPSPQKQPNFTDLASFTLIAEIKTFAEFWGIWDAIGDETLLNGYFYTMRDDYPPMWEHPKNFRGGTYTLRIKQDEYLTPVTLYYKYCIAAMLNELATNPDNKITGVRISNKRGFNIIHIWNEDSTKFKDPAGINLYHTPNPGDEVRYEEISVKRY